MNEYKHWRLETDAHGIAWLTIDRSDSSVNSLNKEVIEEFNSLLDGIIEEKKARGLVIQSGKSTGFIVGADIDSFTKIQDVNEAVELVRKAQKIFDKLENLSMPTVAMIEGPCLGGGLELALACDYRIALMDRKTKLGLPEVMLGIHPGWGGTVRLPQLIGVIPAMDLILSGRTVSAKNAKAIGIVDEVVPKRHIKNAAISFVIERPASHSAPWYDKVFMLRPIRQALAGMLRKKVAARALPEHYPAPYAVIDNWVKNGAMGERAYIDEANSIGKLLLSETSRNLVRVFFLQERMKGLAKQSQFKAQHVHVIGAGTMGGDIAAWCALRGLKVTIHDREPKLIAPAIKRAHKLFTNKLKDKRAVQNAMDRLIPDLTGKAATKADVIIEAIFENLEVKRSLFKSVEAMAKPTAILATNTSSIPLDEINTVMQHPERLVGIHFFNPVSKMPLVEVVQGDKTSEATMQDAFAFVRSIDRLPLPVKSSPGFLVNRILMPYLMECVALVDEGVSIEAIDKAAVKFGMPMGPVELADTVGLDVCLSVAKNMTAHFGGTVPTRLEKMVADGKLGKKSGQGFYQYKNGKPIKSKNMKSEEDLQKISNRLVMRLVNESFAVLREQVVADKDLLDAGMIFGSGFAPFRGGPMHYAESLGKEQLAELFKSLEQNCGDRFKPDAAIMQLAAE